MLLILQKLVTFVQFIFSRPYSADTVANIDIVHRTKTVYWLTGLFINYSQAQGRLQ